ncbi:MAG TPA: ferrous iron transport protein B [Anaerolineae bacterium]|nr:ferrous iron transport protein B [Anaerolineae bacterium]HUM35626.1 ferrous iron transport protein B [Anaerolineae bacterium]
MTVQPRTELPPELTCTAPVVIALAGQPNVGKSTIFNMLTGLNQHVGNWPGKTVERKSGLCSQGEGAFTLIDLPGTYSLTANSEEERIARDFIVRERPDVVIAVVDAAILERSLYLLTELLLLPAPVILALNMLDVAEQEGIHVEPAVLEAALGIPVVPMSAARGMGFTELLETVRKLLAGEIPYHPQRPTIRKEHELVLGQLLTLIEPHVPQPYPADWVALKLLEGDDEITALMQAQLPPELWTQVHALLHQHEDAILDIAGARYEWIERMVRAAVVRPRLGQMGLTARLDTVFTHPLWGTLVLLGVLGGVFGVTYALGSPLQEALSALIEALAEGIRQALAGAPPWLGALLADGVMGGAGMVITFLPILLIFFTALALLEDTGYMARIAYLADRVMHTIGLHGKSFVPLLLGFGCNVPAVLGSRIIETRRARLLTLLLAPLVPCTARMAVVAVLAPVFFGGAAVWVSWGLVALNGLAVFAVGLLLHRVILRGEQVAFIMELPLYHLPNARTVALYVWNNLVAFLRKAGTVILGVSVGVWALSYFPHGEVTGSYLATAGQWLEPLGRLLGVPWQMMAALLTSFVAKENTIATLSILYGDFQTILPQVMSPAAALGYLVTQMLFIPCVATVVVMQQEAGTRWMALGLGLLLVLSLGGGIAVYHLAVLAWGL